MANPTERIGDKYNFTYTPSNFEMGVRELCEQWHTTLGRPQPETFPFAIERLGKLFGLTNAKTGAEILFQMQFIRHNHELEGEDVTGGTLPDDQYRDVGIRLTQPLIGEVTRVARFHET